MMCNASRVERDAYPSRVFVSGSGEKMCIVLVCSGSDTVIRVYDANGSMKSRIDNAQVENYGSAFNYHHDFFACGSFGSDTKVFAIVRSNSTHEYQRFIKAMSLSGVRSSVYDVSFDQHDRVAVVGKEGSLFMWTVGVRYEVQEDPHLLSRVELKKGYNRVTMHPLEDLAVVALGREGAIVNPVTGEVVKEIDEMVGSSIQMLESSPDGKYFAVLGANEKMVTIWKYNSSLCCNKHAINRQH